jgi:uncharacterized protein with von Willebrand factor type A (vWA) domain
MSVRKVTARTENPADPLVARIMEFLALLRRQGFGIGVREGLDALRIAERYTMIERERLRWALRSLLSSNAEEWKRFDELFEAYWLPESRKTSQVQPATVPKQSGLGEGGGAGDHIAGADRTHAGEGGDAAEEGTRGGASWQESTGQTDFRLLNDPREVRAIEDLAERLARRMRRRVQRRQRLARYGRRINLRRTIRASLRYGGTPLDLAYQRRLRVLPRLILLLDVSRSMSLYSYFFLRFARGMLGAFRDAHAFIYHTRLIPVSDVLRERNADKVKEKLGVIALGWAGGTRIGESVQVFNQHYASKLLNSRSIVVVMSDGFDTGPATLLSEQLTRIRRRARKIVWLNPLLGREGYEPLAAGMQAALPLIDVFASAHNLESLAALEDQLVNL